MACCRLAQGVVLTILMPLPAAWASKQPTPFTGPTEQCIVPASFYHGVNHYVLRSILSVESGLKPHAINRNGNGSVDMGIGQMNSVHFKELGTYGIVPAQLKDACTGTYIAAWHLKKGILKYGNTWFGIASYHSATPYFNTRYQILLRNELIKSNVVVGRLTPVPPLKPKHP